MSRLRFRRKVDPSTPPTSPHSHELPTVFDELFKALSVMVRDRKIRAYLAGNDPQALMQAELALHRYVEGWSGGVAGRTRELLVVQAGLAEARSYVWNV